MATVILSRRNLAMAILHKLRPAAARPFSAKGSSSGEENPIPVVVAADSVVGPLVPIRLSMDRMLMVGAFGVASAKGIVTQPRMDYDVWEDEKAFYLRLDMPGLGLENVKFTFVGDSLTIFGDPVQELGEEVGEERTYAIELGFPTEFFDRVKMKIEMKNGVMKVWVPKVAEPIAAPKDI